MALSKTTQDHDEIRRWAETRGAKPAEVASTAGKGKGQTGILRLEFPGAPRANDAALAEIGWEEFFEKFDASGLEFLYEDVTAVGKQSNFNKLIYPESGVTSVKKVATKKTAAKKVAAKASVAKKVAVKAPAKVAAKKSAAKKAPAKKTAVKKAAAKKVVAKKVAAKVAPKTKTDYSKVPYTPSHQVL